VIGRAILTTKKREPSHETDRQRAAWMVAAQAGDRAAYEALLRDCVSFIQAVARRQGVPRDLIDDVVQDTLLAVHGARHTYDPRRSFSGWLAVIAQRRAIDVLRSVGRRGRREVHAPPEYENHPDESTNPERDVEVADRLVGLAPAIAALPEKQRQAVRHLVIEERSLSETAALTGDTKGALKVNLHRALRKLRALLNKSP
jgi:RNA polymerase sigma factor (sigma-70 family)